MAKVSVYISTPLFAGEWGSAQQAWVGWGQKRACMLLMVAPWVLGAVGVVAVATHLPVRSACMGPAGGRLLLMMIMAHAERWYSRNMCVLATAHRCGQ
jgi:hypothetical protein